MTDQEINELERLIQEYNTRYGEGKGDEISGALWHSHSIETQIKIFKHARGREILLEPDPDAIDGMVVNYTRNKLT